MATEDNQTRKEPELRIRGVSQKTQNEVKNIAKRLDTSMSALLRPKIYEIVNSYPEYMRRPMLDD